MSGKRRTAREMALQMLYQRDLGGTALPQIFHAFDTSEYLVPTRARAKGGARARPVVEDGELVHRMRQVVEAFTYAKTLVTGTVDHLDEIDCLIREQADNWRLERMPAVDRNILRLAIFEMLYEQDVPKLVVVDEAIELAKRFGSENSGRFVNGLLDGLLKHHAFPGTLK